MNQEIKNGLYTPSLEHDNCGIGFVANLKGNKSHYTISGALKMLENMEHRGACGCEGNTGDGAGILFQVPHSFFVEQCRKIGFELPDYGAYGVGMVFFPRQEALRKRVREIFENVLDELGVDLIGYRVVPTDSTDLGDTALKGEPQIEQVFVKSREGLTGDAFERRLFVLRKYAGRTIRQQVENMFNGFYICSFSYKTIIYKGQLRTMQVQKYFLDLQDETIKSALAVVHSRFSTNTFPSWRLSQPFRYVAHNGEINTVQGNINWMNSKQKFLESTLFTAEEVEWLIPICDPRRSDSSNLDNVVELLAMGGRPIEQVMMMMIPEAWQEDKAMDENKRAFYEYYSSIMEPWDGPASVSFTDGKVVGATLDRNGLRPSRYCVTSDGILIMSSEAGSLPVDERKVIKKGRLQPGKIFVADLEEGRIISDEEIKNRICSQQPYREWLASNRITLNDLPIAEPGSCKDDVLTLLEKQQAYGYSKEDLQVILEPMAKEGKAPIGSMGADTPLAILSEQSQHLSNYFKQRFAQVSNPPIDPIRERIVMSLFSSLGTSLNIMEETPYHCRNIHLEQPVLTNTELEKLRQVDHPHFKTKEISAVFKADGKAGSLERAIDKICEDAETGAKLGNNIILVSNREIDKNNAPIPSLLAAGAIHHHLIRNDLRARVSIVVEAGDIIEVHHFATLIGYGVNAINPYLAFESLQAIREHIHFPRAVSAEKVQKNYIKAVGKGLLKVFSKMGISTLQSYHGAQIFEALGIGSSVIDKCFSGTISRIEGLDFDGIARESLAKHKLAFNDKPRDILRLETGGVYQWKRKGEAHLFNPQTIHLLQHSTRTNNYDMFKKYAEKINNQFEKTITLRSLLDFKPTNRAIPIEEVESVESIMKRFNTGAMSFGSISHEAHSTLAIAMNRIGAKSNSGEGGEDPIRFERKPNGDWERSAMKQVASGRFGVTSYYLTNADELQIKVAQGAKPGEGGQLPGHKVDEWIGRVRHSTPGVGLISPPPHHDIYSIEDLAQLIYDLKNANRDARINVKLVAEAGVGTIAAGVAKAKADVVMISGYDGGTGASPLGSIRHAGLPWELGLAEAHQTLVKNGLRSRITVQTDGQIRTGKDIIIATLLGAEEWGVATAALVVEGCIMMRKCHLNTCPVGIATQNKELRKLFTGNPEHVVNFFTFLAMEVREYMAQLGFRAIDDMVGQAPSVLHQIKRDNKWKLEGVDLSPILYNEKDVYGTGLFKVEEQDTGIDEALDWELINLSQAALKNKEHVSANIDIVNVNRSIGAMLSNEISKKYRDEGLPEGTIHVKFKGSAGQSFGVFGASGIRFELEGEANDYFGKGLSGGQLIVYPPKESTLVATENMIVGNVAFYGATSGEAYINGLAGERFCVRNSGATAVVEGIGDHGCEYMTGGVAVILGETGKNFAAGMSGGVAYVYDKAYTFSQNCNMELVELEALSMQDRRQVKRLIKKHHVFTHSPVAQAILAQWDVEVAHFVKIMPIDYKRVLAQKAKKKIAKKTLV